LDLDCEDCLQAAVRLRRRVVSDAQLRYSAKDDACISASTSEPSSGSEEADSTADESEDERTTLMLRNLPRFYTRTALQRLLDSQGFVGSYCFLYVPTDFKTLTNNGYAFIGFSDNAAAGRAKRLRFGSSTTIQ
jgi:hypothetical protein